MGPFSFPVSLRHGGADLLLLAGVCLVFLWYRQKILRPLKEFRLALDRYEKGDLASRAPLPQGLAPTEIKNLARHFNLMAEKIEGLVNDIRKLDDLKNEFVSTVSHELKTPLTSINGYTKLILNGDAGPVNETQREFLGLVELNVSRLSELINDILDIERMDAGRVRLSRARVELVPLLKECVTSLSPVASVKGLALQASLPDQEVIVLGDRARLGQIFLNLLSNAVKYTQSGSVAVSMELQPYAVTIHVKDTGIGMSTEEMEKVFQRFYRTPSAQMTGEGGTGLGLAIARALAESHGGQIQVESAPGQGSDFMVSLPLARPEAVEATANPKLRVLLADRDPRFRAQVRRALESHGVRVDEVDRGSDALGRLEEDHYEVALLDLNLADLSGEALIGAARARVGRGKAMRIFATLDEQQSPPSREGLLRIGADQYVGRHSGIGGVVDSILQHLESVEGAK